MTVAGTGRSGKARRKTHKGFPVTQLGQQAVEGLCEQINRYNDPEGDFLLEEEVFANSKMESGTNFLMVLGQATYRPNINRHDERRGQADVSPPHTNRHDERRGQATYRPHLLIGMMGGGGRRRIAPTY